MNDQGVPVEFHQQDCGVWMEEDCTCVHSMNQDAWVIDYDDWEEANPPRISKGAKPAMGVSGRSIFDIVRQIAKGGKKK